MKVEINKKVFEVGEGISTLEELLEATGLAGPGRAVAVNNKVISRLARKNFPLEEGMKITVITAVCGG